MNILKTKPVTATFSIIALVSGFIFINQNLTGNVISNKPIIIDLLSFTGFLLIICSFILAIYSTKRRR